MIKAVIFDFDGLIVDTESVWFEAYKEVLQRYEVELTLQKFSEVVGTSDEILFDFINTNLKEPIEKELIEQMAKELVDEKLLEPALRESVEDYLISAKNTGLKIALASSSSREWVESFLKKLNIYEYFSVIKTKDDVKKVKPDPELYLKAIEEIGVQASEAVAFEDSLNGLIAARKAGLHCVIVPNQVTSHLEFENHSLRLSSMAEKSLEDVIKHLTNK
ncbi:MULTISPECIES: HAD-IA family hydrolase [Bacillaceae]|uniref:HAD family hydrolase n=1 Tax=Gottfriedia luciferensis TaxID=178774 RepID=A0ABX2ZU86_9BACI|nr:MULTISPECIES: HAD-IA family hydrolase [Bacillaceae]ODG93323.1 HAD family hydrolase [Gottfriedia luciferensis]PGZ95022.1 HAD family hydrolase [Bacillus sp. AFS029533]SFC50587.1 putative hydrolase of the HAD superfamily [Bacillus sp. UNCCL81]